MKFHNQESLARHENILQSLELKIFLADSKKRNMFKLIL